MCSIECRRIFSAKMRIWFCKNIAFLKTAHKKQQDIVAFANNFTSPRNLQRSKHRHFARPTIFIRVLYLFVLLYLKILSAPKGDPCFAFTGRMPHFCFCYSIAFARLLKNQPFFSREARKKKKTAYNTSKKSAKQAWKLSKIRKSIIKIPKNAKNHLYENNGLYTHPAKPVFNRILPTLAQFYWLLF